METMVRRAAAEPFVVRWHVRDLRSGREWLRDAGTEQWSASTRKVSVLLALLERCNRGLSSLDERLVLDREMSAGVQSGVMKYLRPGFEFTLRDAAANMIMTSDNVCTGAVFAAMGASERERVQAVNDYCRQIGMRGTVHRHSWLDTSRVEWHHTDEGMTTTTASDQVNLLSRVLLGREDPRIAEQLGVTSEQCGFVADLMRAEIDPLGFGGLLPPGVDFGSKSGRDVRGRGHIGFAGEPGDPRMVMAVYVDWMPTELRDGRPGQAVALHLIADLVRLAWQGVAA